MKKRTILNFVGLFVVFSVIAIAPSINTGIPLGNRAEFISTNSPDENNFITASSTVKDINSDDIVGEPNVVVEYNVETGVEKKVKNP